MGAPDTPLGLAVWMVVMSALAIAGGVALAAVLRGVEWLIFAATMIVEDWRARPLLRDRTH